MLQEYPERQSGLSRLERKLLRTVDSLGVTTPAAAVGTALYTELVGDVLLFDMLRAFITAPHPLLRFAEPFKGKFESYQFNGSKIGVTDTWPQCARRKSRPHHAKRYRPLDRRRASTGTSGALAMDERVSKIVSQRKQAAN